MRAANSGVIPSPASVSQAVASAEPARKQRTTRAKETGDVRLSTRLPTSLDSSSPTRLVPVKVSVEAKET